MKPINCIKTAAALCILCLSFARCDYSTLDGGSYVYSYFDGPLKFHGYWFPDTDSTEWGHFLELRAYPAEYDSSYRRTWYNRNSDIGKMLSEKHNDISSPIGAVIGKYAYVKDFESIELYSDKDFDDAHPTGTSLLDLVVVQDYSPYRYIQNGYKGFFCPFKWGDKLEEEDLTMLLGPTGMLVFKFQTFPQPPFDTKQHLFLKLTATDGETQILDTEFDFGEHEDGRYQSWANSANGMYQH